MSTVRPPFRTDEIMQPVLVGSRGSELALRQTEEVLHQLRAVYGESIEFRVITVRTGGDVAAEAPLASLGKGVFVKEIERALLDGEVRMAVHSLKDVTTAMTEELVIGAVCRRLDPRDILVNRWGCRLADLPSGARIGTSSPRREAQLRSLREDVQVLPMRGNVETRLQKAVGDDYDGAVLAAAGVLRLGYESQVAEFLSTQDFVPAPGQGALAVEVRHDDEEMNSLLSRISHSPTRRDVTAERAFLEALGGGCRVPVGAHAQSDGDTMVLTVFVASPDGREVFRAKVRGRAANPHEVAMDGYLRLIERGAGALLSSSGN